MAEDLDEALGYLLDEEGGWSNNPADGGGATFNGVTQAVYDDWRVRLAKQPKQSVRKAAASEIHQLYDVMYWRAGGCDRLPWPLSYLVFDAAVNSGVSRGVRWLQAGLGVPQDGQIGPATIAAAQQAVAAGNGKVLLATVSARSDFLADLVKRVPSQTAFLKGWWRRTLRVLARSLLSQDS